MKPAPGDWSLMRQHIREVLAAGDEEADAYVVRWCAWAVQNPDKRAETALVLRSIQGTGKGALGNPLMRIFGQHAVHVSNSDHLTGRFNAHFRDASFVFADEAFWAGNKNAEGTLKRMITEPTLAIEAKFQNLIMVPNCLHVLVAANADWGGRLARGRGAASSSSHRSIGWATAATSRRCSTRWRTAAARRCCTTCWRWNWATGTRAISRGPRRWFGSSASAWTPLDKWVAGLVDNGILPRNAGGLTPPPDVAVSRSKPDIDGRNYRDGLFDEARVRVPGLRNRSDDALADHLKKRLSCHPWQQQPARLEIPAAAQVPAALGAELSRLGVVAPGPRGLGGREAL